METLTPDAVAAQLDADKLIAAAREQSGLHDFGDDDFEEGLKRFVASARDEGRLNQIGLMAVCADATRFLINRLRFTADLAAHPEILDEDVSDPIVVTGLPRTGTSKLQRMMSADPAVQKLYVWRLLNPAPFPPAEGPDDPRLTIAQQYDGLLAQFPDFQAAHPTRSDEVDEELLLFEMTFKSVCPSFRVRTPSYLEWVRGQDLADTYTYVRSLLQYLQWQDGGAGGRPWVLKTPVHIGYLDHLFSTFPHATVVHCHRDPLVVIPSFARAVEASRGIASSDIDLHELGLEQLDLWSDALTRNIALREQLGVEHQILDVAYSDIRDTPEAVIEEIHRIRGRDLTPDALAAMVAWDAQNPQHAHGKHTYSLERFGLEGEQVRRTFSAYSERFTPVLQEAR